MFFEVSKGLRGCRAIFAAWALTVSIAAAQPAPPGDVAGVWWSPRKDARIELYRSGQKMMGRVVWAVPEKRDRLDVKNPDRALRGRRIVGSTIFSDFVFADGKWIDGRIYDPDSGRTWSCTMQLVDPDTLSVHGYIGIPLLGRSERFTRFHGE